MIRQGGERNDKEYEKGILSILISNQVIFVLAFAFICQVGLSFYGGFTSVYLLNLGYGQGTIGLLNCISALSEVPVLFFANKLLKKVRLHEVIDCLLHNDGNTYHYGYRWYPTHNIIIPDVTGCDLYDRIL